MRMKQILVGLIMLAVALAATIVAIVKSVDFNSYKGVIAGQVKAATGRDLVLAGDVEVGISLTPRLTVHQVAFRNADWGSEPSMLGFETLTAEIELLPLLTDEIRIKRLILAGADILLERNSDGTGNWVFDPSRSRGGETDGATALPFVAEIEIDKLRLRYRAGPEQEATSLVIDRLTMGAKSPGAPLALAVGGSIGDLPVSLAGEIGNLAQMAAGPLPIDLKGDVGGVSLAVAGRIEEPATLDGADLDVSLTAEKPTALPGLTLPGKGPYRLSGHMRAGAGTYRIEGLNVAAGASAATGEATWQSSPVRPMLDLRLATSRFDFGDLGLAPGSGDGTKKTGDGRVFSTAPWNIPALDFFDAAIKLSGQEFVYGDLVLTNASADLSLTDGKLVVTSLIGNLGDGRVALAGSLDTKTSPAQLDARFRADDVAAGPLLSALGLSGMIAGERANLELALAGPATSLHDLVAAAKGNALFEMGQGRLESSLVRVLFAGLADLVTFGGSGDSARVNCLVTRFKVTGGIALGQGMVLDTPGVTILGTGDIDLGAERLNLRLDSSSKQVNLANLAVPVTVSGPLASPIVVPDPVGAVGSTVDFAARTANLATFGVLSSVTGLGESQNLGADPCRSALEAGAKAKSSAAPTGGSVIDGAGQVIKGVGQGAGDVLEGIGEGIGNLFGN